jgi:hypothetical protein
MSHFTVLVIGPDFESQLAPFQENNMGDCPKTYLEFNDQEDELLKEYNEGSSERVLMPDGRKLHTFDDAFRVPNRGVFDSGPSHVVPKHLTTKKIPLKELYATFEEFAEDYHGKEERDPIKGRFGYWENPNAKWDWFVVGGRWGNFFKLKRGRTGKSGRRPLVMGGGECNEPGHADQVLKRDIDIIGMRKDAEDAAAKAYDFALSIVEGTPPNQSWEVVRDEHGEDMDAARKAYRKQPRIVAWDAADKAARADRKSYWPFGIFDGPDFLLTTTREQYIARARAGAISTHSVLKDGKWHERGSMGWWGCVHDEKDEETWLSMFNKLIDDLPEDTLFTVVDCHI